MKKETKETIKKNLPLIILEIILILNIIVNILLGVKLYNVKAHAEDTETLTTPQILNFNQQINQYVAPATQITFENGDYFINGSLSSSQWLYLNIACRIYSDHTYYFFVKQSNNSYIEVVFDLSGANFRTSYSKVLSPSVSGEAPLYFRVNQTNTFNNYKVNFYLIDLTLMYGENTPTLEECEQIFTSDYYNYTTGTPVNANYFSNYLDAYNDIMQSYKYQLSTTALSNYTFSYDYNGDESYFEYRDDGTQTWYFLNTFAVPLFTKINANAQVTINYYLYAPNFTLDYYLNVMAYDSNGNLITIFTETQPIDTGAQQQTVFTIPFDVDVLFFNCRYNNNIVTTANFMLYNFELSANQLDLTTLAFNAQESARAYYDLYYGVGGQGYNNIYNAGFGAGSDSQKPFTDTWDFIGQSFHGVGEILSMELIPGLPLGLFVALPLLVGLLFFIVKIAKGSGG